ncbi:MAG: class I SAM-dependent methyltransferase, partial [Acidimicrobiales bacterium]
LDIPMRPSWVAAIVAVHVLHLVPDLDGALDQAVASLRPGGRLLVSGIEGDRLPADEIGAVFGDLDERLRRYPAPTVERLESAGFALVHDGLMAPLVVQQSPTEAADQLAARTWSWCWDIPADRWRGEVEPVIAALRALPDPDAPRDRRLERRFVVLERR